MVEWCCVLCAMDINKLVGKRVTLRVEVRGKCYMIYGGELKIAKYGNLFSMLFVNDSPGFAAHHIAYINIRNRIIHVLLK